MKIKHKKPICILRSFFGVVIAAFLLIALPFYAHAAGDDRGQSTASVELATSTTLLFLGNQNIAPIIYLENDKPTGVVVDITKALAPYISRSIEVRAMDWPTAQTLVAEGKADALMQINQTEERKKIYDFSDPLLESQFFIFVRSDRIDISELQNLYGKKVGVEKGGLPQQTLTTYPEIQLVATSNFIEGFKQLSDGVLDAVVVDYRVGSYTLATNDIRNIRTVGRPIAVSYSAFAVKKGNTKLLNEINGGLRAIKANGIYQAILTKWKPTETVFQTQEQITHEIYIVVIVVLSVLSLIVIAWVRVINKELSARKKAEKYAEKLVSSANAMIVGLDIKGRVIVFNEAAEKITGYRKDEVMGRGWFELVVPRDRYPETWKIFEEFQRQGKSIVGEFQNPIITKSGEERIIEWRNSDLRDNGAVVGTISYGINITDRKKAEDALRKNEEALKKAQRLGRIGNWDWDIATDTISWSEEYCRIFGFDPAQHPPKYEEHLKVYTPESAARLNAAVKKNIQTGESYELDLEIADPKGPTRWITARSEAVYDAQGKIIGLRGTAQDITERKRIEEQLKELDKLKDDFLMVTTHELKSPLIPIKSQSQLLLAGDYGALNKEQKEAVEMIYRNGEAVNTLANEVLDISKIKAKKLKIIPEEIALGDVVTEAVKDVKDIATQKNIMLLLAPIPELPKIMADRARIKQVLLNLLDNAIKFTPENGIIDVKVAKTEDDIVVSVKDSGIGLNKNDIAKLFTPFFQVESDVSRKYRGTGLGLAISKGLIEAHGGTVRAESEGEGKGSTFVVMLPIRAKRSG